jgi:hypothetical protein
MSPVGGKRKEECKKYDKSFSDDGNFTRSHAYGLYARAGRCDRSEKKRRPDSGRLL